MKFCDKCVGETGACCDFCFYYDFNANEFGEYTGKGYCNFHHNNHEPFDVCDEFKCEHIKKG